MEKPPNVRSWKYNSHISDHFSDGGFWSRCSVFPPNYIWQEIDENFCSATPQCEHTWRQKKKRIRNIIGSEVWLWGEFEIWQSLKFRAAAPTNHPPLPSPRSVRLPPSLPSTPSKRHKAIKSSSFFQIKQKAGTSPGGTSVFLLLLGEDQWSGREKPPSDLIRLLRSGLRALLSRENMSEQTERRKLHRSFLRADSGEQIMSGKISQ